MKIAYDNALAHKIEAGADMFLMPSRYEPCGLNQIYSLKYGTVPVVRATGGLDDTIEAFDPETGRGTGFKFQAYDGAALLGAIRQALAIFRNEPGGLAADSDQRHGQGFLLAGIRDRICKALRSGLEIQKPKSATTSNQPGQSRLRCPRQFPQERVLMADNVNNVTDSTFQAEVIDASKTQPVMVDFWAEWCRPCLMLAPTVAEIATAYAGKIKVVKLNVDENTNSAGKFNIRGIPTLLIFKGGQVAEQVVGAVPRDQIEKAVQRHLV